MRVDTKKTGSFIQLQRKLAGLTQAQLGERVNVTSQSVSNWERGLLLPDTAALPDLAEILQTTVDAILAGGECPPRYHRKMTVSRIREAINYIHHLKEIFGTEHPFYKTMTDALNTRMNSNIDLAFQSENAMDAYICEALLFCLEQGDYVDRDDILQHIANPRAAEAVITRLDELDVK